MSHDGRPSPPAAGPVVVLGATGWLGTHLVDRLRSASYDVIGVARSGPADVHCDLAVAGPAEWAELVGGASAVINCTDRANATDGWHHDRASLDRTNVAMVGRLVCAVRAQPEPPRLVHAGSILEYGGSAARAWNETDRCAPTTDYARSKLAGSEAVVGAAHRDGPCTVVLRLGHLVGPRPSPASLPGRITRALLDGRSAPRVRLTATRDERDFVDVRDVAAAVAAVLAVDADRVTGRVLNISSGRPRPVLDLVAGLVEAAGMAEVVDLRVEEMASFGGSRTWASTEAARAVLGWAPRHSLGDGLRAMWDDAVAAAT